MAEEVKDSPKPVVANPVAPVTSLLATPAKPQVVESKPLTAQEKMVLFCQSLVKIEPVAQPSRFNFRGVCTKCGFQSYEKTEADARGVVAHHAMKHWYDTNG